MSETFSNPIAESFEIATVGKGKVTESDSPALGKGDVDTDIPASIYEQRHGVTLASEILNTKGDSQDSQQKLKAIDEYVKDKILEEDLEDTQESYQHILNELMRVIGITNMASNRVDKLYQIITLRRFLN